VNSIKIKLQNLGQIKSILWLAIAVFFIKFIIIIQLDPEFALDLGKGNGVFLKGILNGSDGENYLNGLLALVNDGIFSPEQILSYFPAGYPIVIYLISKLDQDYTFIFLSTIQSFIFSYSVYFLSKYLIQTKLKKYTTIIFLMIILNPTLSLSSIIIGYESLTASGSILIIALLIKFKLLRDQDVKNQVKTILGASIICGFISFLQPRLILGLLLIIFITILNKEKIKKTLVLIIISTCITLIFPASLVYRNFQATGIKSVSTNLGTTMNLGAGENTKGSYWDKNKGTKCDDDKRENRSDSEIVKCVLKWYIDNPKRSFELFVYKSIYFWSPWVGPIAEGTTGRNPWLRYGPYNYLSENYFSKLYINERIEIILSQIWQISTIIFLGVGVLTLIRMKSMEAFLGLILAVLILINWGITLLTIGDNRFRIPISGATILLQSVGILIVVKKILRILNNK
jgi:hypothetical protein